MKSFRTTLAAALVLGISAVLLASDDPKNLEATPQVRAYRALLAAMKAGDYAAYKNRMVKEAGPRMDETTRQMGKDPKDVLSFMATLTPPEVVVTGLEIDGKKAVLHAVGRLDGEVNYGTVDMCEEDGQWKVGLQSWTTRKAGTGASSTVVA